MNSGINAVLEAAKNTVIQHEILLNNLSNIDTTGFREQTFSLILDKKKNNVLKNKEYYLKPVVSYSDKPGSIQETNRLLDIAPLQNYWITLKNPILNQEMYTRNGHMSIDSKNRLTVNNYLVLGEKGYIVIPNYENINFLEDGTIIYTIKGKKKYLGKLKLTWLRSKDVKKNGYSFCYDIFNKTIENKKIKENNELMNEKKIKSKSLETSNVDLTKNLLQSIDCCRKFDFYTSIVGHDIENNNLLNKFVDINS
ncbi:Flagellar basal-body rod protein FlgF [Buchnera aphidicola (Anoecia corni)]|uniref:Flagellar basal-body rod protein FlgF n=1 Tax=Buchnera aphidicola (Anoecia corni) TaxID=2994477 RepID=A0AAT9IGK6_9GAMM